MVELVVLFFVVYLAIVLMVAVLYSQFVRWNIVHVVQQAGGELLQMQRLDRPIRAHRPTRRAQGPPAVSKGTYYMVKYRTSVGHELTRLCKLSLFGGVFWYDEE